MKSINIYIVLAALFMLSCKRSNDNLKEPPIIRYESIKVIDSLKMPVEAIFRDTMQIMASTGSRVELTCGVEAEGKLSQIDIIVYGLAKDVDNNPIDTSYLVNSFGQKTDLLGIPAIDWPNTSFRQGFLSENKDRFKIILPKITGNTEVVI